ncbi:MAG: HAMP domain-containing histidine kinase [Sulfurimonas sp.]|nr:HAMP domain-containing histidine kinase [Sulfurimonas sp.]
MKFNSLKTRVLAWFGTVILFLLILFSIFFHYFLNKSINNNIETKLFHEALKIKEKFLLQQKNNVLTDDKNLASMSYAIMQKGTIILKSKNFDLSNLNTYFKSNNSFFIMKNKDNDETINALYILRANNYKICVYQKNIDNKIENLEDILLFLNPILLLLVLMAASKLIDKILLPIKHVTKTAKEIGVNDFSHTISLPQEDDEIKELVDSFNTMIIRLKDGVESLDRFNSDVSHELRTPLTVIRGEVEVTLRKLREPQEYEKSMQTIYYEVQQMQKIVEDLLLLTKYSKENIRQSFEPCSLDSILLSVVDKFDKQLKEKNINLVLQNIEPISINANPFLISSIFSNLLDNSIKYTPNSKSIYLFLYKDKQNNINFEIKDEGVGIEEDKLHKITDRFYRVDDSRNKKVQGFGLGLSIVKNSVELHNAKMEINSNIKKGTDIRIIFNSSF